MMISVLLLMGIIIFTVHVFEKQKLIVIKANQNIDIVDIMNQMRGILSSPENCQATFNGQGRSLSDSFTGVIDVVKYRNTDVVEVEKFSTLLNDGIRYGESKIGVDSYSIKEVMKIDGSLSKYDFQITFDRGFKNLRTTKSFPIYLKFGSDQTVKECSLGRIKTASKMWKENSSSIYYEGTISLNTPNSLSTFNINKGIKFLKNDMKCGKDDVNDNGLISYSRSMNDLMICLEGRWYSLLKKRGVEQ